jgi:hypothetical protein
LALGTSLNVFIFDPFEELFVFLEFSSTIVPGIQAKVSELVTTLTLHIGLLLTNLHSFVSVKIGTPLLVSCQVDFDVLQEPLVLVH